MTRSILKSYFSASLFAIVTIGLAFSATPLQAQTESELIGGDWHCAVEGMEEPILFQLLEEDKAQMCNIKDGRPNHRYTKGDWKIDDMDYDDDDQPVITIKVTWERGAGRSDEMIVKLTMLSEDKMEVRWQQEPMRIWTRVKTDGEEDDDKTDR